MRKFTPALIGALGAAALATAGLAYAQSGDGPHHGPMTRTEAEAQAAKIFAKLDANGDGVLDAKDREARVAEHFAKLDTDGNGSLSLKEFEAGMAGPGGPGGPGGRHAESWGDPHEKMAGAGPDGRSHGKRHKGERGPGMMGDGMMGETADANGDHAISLAEFKSAALARFDAVDTNHDGTITKDELKAARTAHKAERMAEKNGKRDMPAN